jgi:hypothetical protein
MALSDSQAIGLLQQPAFLGRVKLQLDKIAQNVYTEVNTTPGHAARALRATAVTNSPDTYLPAYALEVIAQLNQATVSMLSDGSDCDATDTTISAALSSVWNTGSAA